MRCLQPVLAGCLGLISLGLPFAGRAQSGVSRGNCRTVTYIAAILCQGVNQVTETHADEPAKATEDASFAAQRHNTLLPRGARPDGVLAERDLIDLVRRVYLRNGAAGPLPAVMQPKTPVTRLRAVAALIKSTVPAGEIDEARDADPDELPPDGARIAAWGKVFVVTALRRGWLARDEELQPTRPATWQFVADLLKEMPLAADEMGEGDTGGYSGLIVDARQLDFERSPNPKIKDEAGNVVYPDPDRLPSLDFIEEHGLASYDPSPAEAKRAGIRPLIVRAIDITGKNRDAIVVTNEAAEMIRAANHREKFLSHWAVSILQSPK